LGLGQKYSSFQLKLGFVQPGLAMLMVSIKFNDSDLRLSVE